MTRFIVEKNVTHGLITMHPNGTSLSYQTYWMSIKEAQELVRQLEEILEEERCDHSDLAPA